MKLVKEIKLTVAEIRSLMAVEEIEFPKYAAPLINLANRFAQATRPKVVGQMSELIKECPYKDFEGWKKWYMSKHPDAIEDATDKIMEMLERFRDTIDKLDRDTVRRWVEELILIKTFLGLRVQDPILKYLSNKLNEKYRLATPEEESEGIDGYLGRYSVSIKPTTYKEKEGIAEERPKGDILIFYKKDRENNIIITEIESLSKKGEKLIEKLKMTI